MNYECGACDIHFPSFDEYIEHLDSMSSDEHIAVYRRRLLCQRATKKLRHALRVNLLELPYEQRKFHEAHIARLVAKIHGLSFSASIQ